jgi:hypothetical protein
MKYYNSEIHAKIGDKIVGAWCGTCEIIEKVGLEIIAKNTQTGEIFDVSEYVAFCDLLERKDLTSA